MKYKSKFKRVKAQAGMEDILTPDRGTQYFQTGYDEFGNPIGYNSMDFSYDAAAKAEQFTTTNPVEQPGTNNDQSRTIRYRTGRFQENPYVTGFNYLASEVTGVANMIQNNRLKDKEYETLVHSLEPTYWENMDGEGLNNLPMYTQYGGGFGPNLEDPGFAHEAFYGDNSIYQAGGGPSASKAKEMLKDGTANGKRLTAKQKRYFGWVAGGKKQAGGIADYLWQKGVDGSFKNRKKLFNDYFGGNYSGSAEQNIKLLNDIQSGKLKVPGLKRTLGEVGASVASGKQQGKVTPVKGNESFFGNILGYPTRAKNTTVQKSDLESGVVVDKRTNQAYVVKGGKVQKQFPVLTGKNPDKNYNPYTVDDLENRPNDRNTPMGAYMLNPNPDIYGAPGFNMNPLYFDGTTPVASNLAMHITYNPAVRNKYYNTQNANQSYGCVNCRKPDLDYVRQQFPKGDTLMVIDSKKGQSLKKMGIKQAGGCDDCDNQMQAGGVPKVYGLPDSMKGMADVEAEAGEVIQTHDGGFVKVADDANTHEQGGEMIPNVKRVLEDTSDKRKDKASKMLKVQPATMTEAFGIKTKSPVTHAKAFEIASDELGKTNKLYQTAKKDTNLRTNLDKTSMNTMRLNDQFQAELPTEDDIFELLFMHQEGVKMANGIQDDGSMAKYGGGKRPIKAQAGTTLKGKQNVSKNLKTPKGNLNQVTFPGGLPALVDKWKALIPGIENVTDPAEFQRQTYAYLLKNQPDLIDQTIWGEGLNRQGINMFKGGKDKAFNEAVNRAFDPKTFAMRPGYKFTQADREALGTAYPDSYLMNRLVVPDISTTTTDVPGEEDVHDETTPKVTSFNPSVNINPRIVQQPNNEFYEPTYWSDVAAPLAGMVDSFRRYPELYNPVEFNQLRYKLLDPTGQLTANQADFNAALDESNNMGTGVGSANTANMLGQKYRANNQVLSQYDNQNAQIKNNEITYNTQVRDKQSIADAQSRGQFYQNVLLGREAQRQQFLTSLGQLSRVDQLKRRQNRSGNLLMKLSPAFDQFGEYNGYQYLPYLDPAMLM